MVSENCLKGVDLALDDGTDLAELGGDLRTGCEELVSDLLGSLDGEGAILCELDVDAKSPAEAGDLVDDEVDGY